MISESGKCIKCGARFINDLGAPTHLYNQLEAKLTSGSILVIGICASCELVGDEYVQALDAIKATQKAQSGFELDGEIIQEEVVRRGYVDILKNRQGDRCSACHQNLGDTWVVTNNGIRHEGC